MRPVVPLLCLLLSSGCAAGTDAALTGQDAKSKLAVKDRALGQLAATQLAVVVQQAQAWSAAHGGSMAGFAEDLRTNQPSVAGPATVLTDTSVSIAEGTGSCLTAALPAGAAATTTC